MRTEKKNTDRGGGVPRQRKKVTREQRSKRERYKCPKIEWPPTKGESGSLAATGELRREREEKKAAVEITGKKESVPQLVEGHTFSQSMINH